MLNTSGPCTKDDFGYFSFNLSQSYELFICGHPAITVQTVWSRGRMLATMASPV